MKQSDYAGLSHFQDYCKDLDEHYVVVGGFATLMLLDSQLENHGKATFDIDLVLLTSHSIEMSQRIKQYIKEGKYTIEKGSKDQYQYYRFRHPQKENFAKEIEFFASNENNLEFDASQRIISIDPEEGLYSLSAIMLDPEYFELIKNNIDKTHRAPCTNTQATIMLKMSAFFDIKNRISKSDDKKWKKHRRDILKLALLLEGSERVSLVGRMIEDFDAFIAHLIDDVDKKTFKAIVDKLPIEKEQVIDVLQMVFQK